MERKKLDALEERKERRVKKNLPRKYVRYREGAEMYGMGLTKFQQLAKEAGAILKVDGVVLVKVEEFERFLDSFKL